MHKLPRNPYEPSVRERLAQRGDAARVRAYKATDKRKYAVTPPAKSLAAKKHLNALCGSGGYGIYYKQSLGRALRPGGRTPNTIFIDYESWTTVNVEERWLTERQATMMRLKGYVVEDT
jgi:hypothetical protein